MKVVTLAIVCLFVGSAQAAVESGEKVTQKLSGERPVAGTCGVMKNSYKRLECCGQPDKVTNLQLVPMNAHMSKSENPCKDKKKTTQPALDNIACVVDGVIDASEQSGSNVTKGYMGTLETDAVPIT